MVALLSHGRCDLFIKLPEVDTTETVDKELSLFEGIAALPLLAVLLISSLL